MRLLATTLTLASAVFLLLSVYYYIEVGEVIASWDSSHQGFVSSLNHLAKAFTMFAVATVAFVIFFLCASLLWMILER